MEFVPFVNKTLAVLTIVANILAVALIVSWAVRNRYPRLLQFATAHAVLFSFIIATAATLGSLFYSEIAGYEPCKLCWFERIFMYPQSLVFLVALWKRERVILRYALLLSLIGCGISLYHYLMQIGFAPSLSCEVVGYSASCAQRFVLQFGYVTIPFMAFSAFLLLALLQIFGVRYIRHSPSAHT